MPKSEELARRYLGRPQGNNNLLEARRGVVDRGGEVRDESGETFFGVVGEDALSAEGWGMGMVCLGGVFWVEAGRAGQANLIQVRRGAA